MRKWLLIGLVMLSVATLRAQPIGSFEMLTVDNTVGGVKITSAVLTGMAGCSLRLETAEIRFTADGLTAPTTTVGTVLEPFDQVILSPIATARAARFIRTGASSGTLAVACWPQP